ncbi:hypothetical protein CY652_19845 [Burkholderia sp. WAC0059]|uniref:hypothetical protein n=1 Tax=Burkholderia sp. WAC0059 TaxID=2066022 RepID=UPI000C7F2240|nr:hypothetical protein [Burkholderia sp. WAC0059]PLZ00712.1 hypothetical protein CY652_19845 [Burkholderia sp. WAC0059]
MNKLKLAVAAGAIFLASAAHAQSVTTGTASTSSQSSNVANTVNFPSGGPINYSGGYDVRTPPTLYAPGLVASVTETCWGSISAGVSVVGVGVTGGATVKDLDCNKRLNAAVAWRMDRKDIAFNIMCQEDDFRDAAALTDHPCGQKPSSPPTASTTGQPLQTAVVDHSMEPTDPFVRARENLPPLPSTSTTTVH